MLWEGDPSLADEPQSIGQVIDFPDSSCGGANRNGLWSPRLLGEEARTRRVLHLGHRDSRCLQECRGLGMRVILVGHPVVLHLGLFRRRCGGAVRLGGGKRSLVFRRPGFGSGLFRFGNRRRRAAVATGSVFSKVGEVTSCSAWFTYSIRIFWPVRFLISSLIRDAESLSFNRSKRKWLAQSTTSFSPSRATGLVGRKRAPSIPAEGSCNLFPHGRQPFQGERAGIGWRAIGRRVGRGGGSGSSRRGRFFPLHRRWRSRQRRGRPGSGFRL